MYDLQGKVSTLHRRQQANIIDSIGVNWAGITCSLTRNEKVIESERNVSYGNEKEKRNMFWN